MSRPVQLLQHLQKERMVFMGTFWLCDVALRTVAKAASVIVLMAHLNI